MFELRKHNCICSTCTLTQLEMHIRIMLFQTTSIQILNMAYKEAFKVSTEGQWDAKSSGEM